MIERICLLPHLTGAGGPPVFQRKMVEGLHARGIEAVHAIDSVPYQAVLVIGGTRQIRGLQQIGSRGVPIIQRLNGMNWIHRRRWTGLKHFIRAEYGNYNLNLIRRRLAHSIVYQSRFAQKWWEQQKGAINKPGSVIYNGVDLEHYSADGPPSPPDDRYTVLVVEGNLAGGYETGLEHAAGLAARLNGQADRPVELVVAGNVPPAVQKSIQASAAVPIRWAGHLPQDKISALDRSAHLLFSADINAACPNSVVEALACGLPVLALESGALPELVSDGAGLIVPYGGSPWKLDPPDLDGLARAGLEILNDQSTFRGAARQQAEARFGLDRMVERYLEVIQRAIERK